MKVLLITFSFPPAGGVGVLRALSLAKYLPDEGIELHVLTARNAPAVGHDYGLLAQVPTNVKVHRTWTLDLPFGLRKAVKKLVSGRAAGEAAQPAGKRGTDHLLKRWVGNLLLPDPQVGWLPFASPAARRIIRRHAIDVVVVTVPPFSAARLITLLRRFFPALPLVLDFRDEWLSTMLKFVSFNKNERASAVAFRTEAQAVNAATCVVTVTEAARRELISRYADQSPKKFESLPNGFDGEVQSKANPPAVCDDSERPVVVTYIGSVYGATDPSTFVEGVLALPVALRARLHLRFIGHVETDSLLTSLLRLGDTLSLKGFIPQADALRAVHDTDFLLLLQWDSTNVSAKFYDYIASGKPIVAAIHPNGEVRRLLEETGTGCWADIADPLAIRNLLAGVLAGTTVFPVPDQERIAEYHRKPIAHRYAQLLHRLARSN